MFSFSKYKFVFSITLLLVIFSAYARMFFSFDDFLHQGEREIKNVERLLKNSEDEMVQSMQKVEQSMYFSGNSSDSQVMHVHVDFNQNDGVLSVALPFELSENDVDEYISTTYLENGNFYVMVKHDSFLLELIIARDRYTLVMQDYRKSKRSQEGSTASSVSQSSMRRSETTPYRIDINKISLSVGADLKTLKISLPSLNKKENNRVPVVFEKK